MNREVLQNILLVVFGLALILVGYTVFAQYQTLNELSARIDSVSQRMMESDQKMDDVMMKVDEAMMKLDEAAMEREEAMMATDCSSLGAGWALYQSNTVDMSFCVNSEWGAIREELENFVPEAATGRIYRVVFGEASPPGGPIISYSSQDFRRLLDSDVPILNWDMIDFSKSEEALAADFAAFEGADLGAGQYIIVTKTTVAGKSALKVESNFTSPLSDLPVRSVHWYVPDAVSNGTYNLEIYSDARIGSDAQLLVDSLEIN